MPQILFVRNGMTRLTRVGTLMTESDDATVDPGNDLKTRIESVHTDDDCDTLEMSQSTK